MNQPADLADCQTKRGLDLEENWNRTEARPGRNANAAVIRRINARILLKLLP